MSETVLVTGGLGYLGGRLLDRLRRTGRYRLRASTRRPPGARPAWAGDLEVMEADTRDGAALERACQGAATVIHLAALNAQACAADPQLAHEVNVEGTRRLVAAAAAAGAKRFVYLSTAHVYGAPLQGVIDENTLPDPKHPYAATHLEAEKLVRASRLDGLVLRLSNAVGAPMDSAADCWMLLCNDLCRQAAAARELVLGGDGGDRRDFVAISGIARAIEYFLALPAGAWGEGLFNIGGGKSRSTMEMAELIARRCGGALGFTPPVRRKTAPKERNETPLDYRIERLLATGFRLENDLAGEIDATLLLCERVFSAEAEADR